MQRPGREGSAALVVRAQAGDLGAFDVLYQTYGDDVYALCLNMSGGDREQAQDLLQETFVKAWRGLRGFRGRSAFRTWLYRVAVNVCRDAARQRRAREAQDLPLSVPPGDSSQTAARVREALRELKKPHRAVLALRYALSLSYEEIAETLNWSLPKVKVTLHRAKAAFREVYCEEDEAEP